MHQRAGECWFLRRNSSVFSEDLYVSLQVKLQGLILNPGSCTLGIRGNYSRDTFSRTKAKRKSQEIIVSVTLPRPCLPGIKQESQAPALWLKDSLRGIMDLTDSWSWGDVWGVEWWMWPPSGISLVEINTIDVFIQLFRKNPQEPYLHPLKEFRYGS